MIKEKSLNPFVRNYNVFLPDKLNLDQLMLEFPIDLVSFKDDPQKLLDNAKYILGQIYSSRFNETHEFQPTNEFTNLCFNNMRSVVRDYKKYINYFLKIGVVLRDGYFFWNIDKHPWDISKCMGYKFTDKYFPKGTKWKKYTIYDKNIVRKRGNRSMVFYGENSKYNPLIDCFYSLSVDMDGATNTLLDLYPDREDIVEQQLELLRRIKTPELWSFTIGKTGRLYNPISNINKNLRKHFKLNGSPLFEIDIKNSIPYQSLVLFDNEKISKNEIINNILKNSNKYLLRNNNEIKKRIYSKIYKGWRGDSYLYLNNDIHLNATKKDNYCLPYNIQLFIEKVLDGTIYEFLTDEWNSSVEIKKIYDRTKAKLKFLSLLNQPSVFDSPERKIFGQIFPDVLLTIDKINSGYMRTNNGRGRAMRREYDLDCPFAYFTQRLESYLILDRVALELASDPLDEPIITLHDAIYTTKKNVLNVMNMIKYEAKELTGNEISLKVSNVATGLELSENDIEYLQILEYEKEYKSLSRSKIDQYEDFPF